MGRDGRKALRLDALRRAFFENAPRSEGVAGFAAEPDPAARPFDIRRAAEARTGSRSIKPAEARVQG